MRRTWQHDLIAEIFKYVDRPLTVDDILRAASQSGRALSTSTAYRCIRLLIRSGRIVTVDWPGGPVRYELAGKEHHHHFTCTSCGSVYDIHDGEDIRVAVPARFKISRLDITMFGVCAACRDRSE